MKKIASLAKLSLGQPMLALLASVLPLAAADIVDPALVFGVNAIDPPSDAKEPGTQTVDQNASNSTPQEVLESLTDLGAIQDFSGWNVQGAPTYIVFTDDQRPDVKGTYENLTGAKAGGGTTSEAYQTSTGKGIKINSGSPKRTELILDFGSATYSGTDGVTAFDPAAKAPSAAGLTVSGLGNVTIGAKVIFYGSDDSTVLSEQDLLSGSNADNGSSHGGIGYAGFQADGTGVASRIGKIRVVTDQVVGSSPGVGVDDLAFTPAGKAH